MSNTYDKQHIVEAAIQLRKQGKTNTEISKILDIPRSTLFDWIGGSVNKVYTTEEIVKDQDGNIISDNVYTKVYNDSSNDSDILKFLEEIKPIVYPAPTRSKVKQESTKTAIVIGDMHFGVEDWNTLNIFFEAVSQIKPEKVILNGDTLDMFAVSTYSKDVRYKQTLSDEIAAYHKFLKILHDITEPWNAEIYETNANHSGNGQEGRWWRYLSKNLGEAASLPQVQESLSYENIFFPPKEWCRVKLVDEVILPTNLIVHHGTVVRKHGGQSARGEFDKIFASTITNHTHRIGLTSQTCPKTGNRPAQTFVNYENACACRLDPDYVKDPNWQNGFSIVNYTDDVVGVEPVVVHGNKANINTIGKVIKV